ncbi:MAG TPA: AsmA family protein [Azospirillaceae bacterium]|nr:AsmA family protein [Azospirillaceae bacterium]
MGVLKWIGIGLAGLIGLGAAGLGIMALTFDANDWRGFVASRLSSALGRQVSIDGALSIGWGDPLRIHAEGVHIANERWSDDPTFFDLRVLDALLRLRPLLQGRIELPEVRLAGPDVIIERNAQGEPNWLLGGATTKAVAPEERSELPLVESLAIEQGRLRLRDPARDMDVVTDLQTLTGGGGGGRELTLAGQGALNGKPLRLEARGGPLGALIESREPYPVRLQTQVGGTQAQIEGTMLEPVQLKGIDLKAMVAGPDLAEVLPLFGFPVPQTPEYRVAGQVGKKEAVWSLRNLEGRMGGSDLGGWLALDLGGERPVLRGDIQSNRLAATDFTGLIGAPPPQTGRSYPTEAPGRVLPDTPIDLAALRTNDLDLSFVAKDVDMPYVPLAGAQGHVRLQAGELVAQPLKVALAGGGVSGMVMLSGRQPVPAVRVDLAMRGIQIGPFFQGTPLADEMAGTLSGRVQLAGQGKSTAQILGNGDGRAAVEVHGGRVSSLVVSALQTDILETLGIALSGEDVPIPFNCIVADVSLKNGLLTSNTLVADTQDTTIAGRATVNLDKELLDMVIEGNPKEVNLLGTQVPVFVRGPFRSPEIAVDPSEAAARTGVAAALSTLLTPLAGMLAFIQPASGEETPCNRLVTNIRDAARKGPRG